MLLRMLQGDKIETIDAAHTRGFVPDRPWWDRLFAAIDSGSAAGFASFLTPDAELSLDHPNQEDLFKGPRPAETLRSS